MNDWIVDTNTNIFTEFEKTLISNFQSHILVVYNVGFCFNCPREIRANRSIARMKQLYDGITSHAKKTYLLELLPIAIMKIVQRYQDEPLNNKTISFEFVVRDQKN